RGRMAVRLAFARGRTPRHLPGQSRMILSPACQEGNIYAGDRSACYPLYWRHLCQTTLIRAPSSSASLTGSTSFDSSMAKIAFIGGTGAEGLGLAMRFAKAGHAVYVGSRSEERAA